MAHSLILLALTCCVAHSVHVGDSHDDLAESKVPIVSKAAPVTDSESGDVAKGDICCCRDTDCKLKAGSCGSSWTKSNRVESPMSKCAGAEPAAAARKASGGTCMNRCSRFRAAVTRALDFAETGKEFCGSMAEDNCQMNVLNKGARALTDVCMRTYQKHDGDAAFWSDENMEGVMEAYCKQTTDDMYDDNFAWALECPCEETK
jgi:hypothetical protein